MKTNYFKLGGIACILLGVMHLIAHLSQGNVDPQMANTLAAMQNTIIRLMGEHTLLQFYNGFSLTMGFLLVAFGLQTIMIEKPGSRLALMNSGITVVLLFLCMKYFHILASAFMLIAFVCFIISFIKIRKDEKSNEIKLA